MDGPRSELLHQQKELLEKLNTHLLYIRRIEDSQEKILDLVGCREEIKKLSSELATCREKEKEQELSKLIDGDGRLGKNSLKFQEQSKNLKRKLPDRRHDSKKSKVEEYDQSSKEEDAEDEDGESYLTPIKPFKRITLKREKKIEEEDYKKEIEKMKKKIQSQKLTIKLNKEQKEKDQSEKENLLTELSKEYSTMKKLFKENDFLETIEKLSKICEQIQKEARDKQSNGFSGQTPTTMPSERQKIQNLTDRQANHESELLEAKQKAQKILDMKEAEIGKLKEENAEQKQKLQSFKSYLSEDREKVLLAIKEKTELSQKIRNLEESLQKSESEVSRLQRLLAEKDVEVKQLESSNSESKTNISTLEESNASLNIEKNQIKAESEKTMKELTSLKSAHEQMKKQFEECRSEVNGQQGLQISNKDRESIENLTSVPEGKKKDGEKLKIEIQRLENEMLDKGCFQTHAEVVILKKTLEEIDKLKDSHGQSETPAGNYNKSSQTERESDDKPRKFKARIQSLKENLKVQKNSNENLNKKVGKQRRMLKNLAAKYVKLQKEETLNADSLQISAHIIDKLENELAERNKAIEQFQL